jgi:hypothetical protein
MLDAGAAAAVEAAKREQALGERQEKIYPSTDLSPSGAKWEDGGRVLFVGHP